MTEAEAVEKLKSDPIFIQLKKKHQGLVNFFTGEVMKSTKNRANPLITRQIVSEELVNL